MEEKELTRIQQETNLDQSKITIFDNTDIAMRSAKLYYKVFRRIIDPSNLDQGNNFQSSDYTINRPLTAPAQFQRPSLSLTSPTQLK